MVFVLAVDERSAADVRGWPFPNVEVFHLRELEEAFPRLSMVRSDRSNMEYLFTLTPWLILWTMSRVRANAWVTYLDADMAFYSSTTRMYKEISAASVAIVEHRFTWEQAWRRKYGRFNVGWVGFRNDRDGRNCLTWWAERCLEWCRDEVSNGRFADQGYLDQFPDRFSRVAIVDLPGANLAPWNLRRHRVTYSSDEIVLVDGQPLIFFHFHGLRFDDARCHFKHAPYFAKTTPEIREGIYRPYCEALAQLVSSDERNDQDLVRKPTLMSRFSLGRRAILQWISEWRGDYIDVNLP